MTITQAQVEKVNGHFILHLAVHGHPAQVFEPNCTLLDAGIVILLDDTGHWHNTLSEIYGDEDGNCLSLPGSTRGTQILDLVRRYNAGEQGDLLKACLASDQARQGAMSHRT